MSSGACASGANRNRNLPITYKNTLTTTYVQRGMIPIIGGTDRETIANAVYSIPCVRENQLRIAWIRNTNQLEEIALSPAALAGCGSETHLEKIREIDWEFDKKDLLISWGKQ
jgi:hypothetical protein